jgi:SAM-dependent methyltransferase
LFSTIGMIQGADHRQRVLEHARRILKPGGLFVIHVHNFWFNLFDSPGRHWLVRHFLQCVLRRDVHWGDKFFDYRRIPKVYLHTFSRRELARALRRAGFRIQRLIPLHVTRQRPLRCPWLFGALRANGWIAVCEARP